MNYIAGNWKSNKNLAEALAFLDELKAAELQTPVLAGTNSQTDSKSSAVYIIAPPFPFLGAMNQRIKELDLPVALGVQDLSGHSAGAFTGQICAENLTDLGVEYAILGHSERRIYCHETHQEIADKVEKAVAAGLKPILCLDEAYLQEQADALDSKFYPELIIAFEPLSAIGTGQSMSVEQVSAVYQKIKQIYGSAIPLLYGGSVTPETVHDYLTIGQGVLVGSASLKALSYQGLCQ